MKKKRLGTCVLIGGCILLILFVAGTFVWTSYTRSGALCVMILKALDIKDVFLVGFGSCVAGLAVDLYMLARLLSDSQEDESRKDDAKIETPKKETTKIENDAN